MEKSPSKAEETLTIQSWRKIMRFIFKHTFIMICFLLAGNVLLKKIQHPASSFQERIFFMTVLVAFVFLTIFFLDFLDRLDEQIGKIELEALFNE